MFPTLTGNGRIWIYVANRPLTIAEQADVKNRLAAFCQSWAAHGDLLSAEFDIFHQQLLVLGVDEQQTAATGCSIDQTSAIFKQIDAELQLDLFNRLNLTFLEGDKVRLVRLSELNQAYQSGIINNETHFLDNTISVLDDLRTRWQVPFKDSWAFKKVKSVVKS